MTNGARHIWPKPCGNGPLQVLMPARPVRRLSIALFGPQGPCVIRVAAHYGCNAWRNRLCNLSHILFHALQISEARNVQTAPQQVKHTGTDGAGAGGLLTAHTRERRCGWGSGCRLAPAHMRSHAAGPDGLTRLV